VAVTISLEFLIAQLDWAAGQHPEFAEFAADIRRVRGALYRVTGQSEIVEKAAAACFDCNGKLVRKYLDHSGLQENWHCVTCGISYSPQRYWLAVRGRLEAQAAE
jgi:hypothetical protein